MNSVTTTIGYGNSPRALRVGEWMGEAALATQGVLSRLFQALRGTPVQQANALRAHAQAFGAVDARMAADLCAFADRHEQLHGDR